MKSNEGENIRIAVPIYESSPVYNEQDIDVQIAEVAPISEEQCIQIADAVVIN